MGETTRKIVKIVALILGVGWLAVTGANQFLDIGSFDYGTHAQDVALEKEMKKCKGTFSQRYECKSALLRARGQQSFYYWGYKVALVFGPPLLIYIFYNLVIGRISRAEEMERRARRLIRIEKEKEEARLRAREIGRQRTIETQRRRAAQEARKEADREGRQRPLNVLVVGEDEEAFTEKIDDLLQAGYFVIYSDFNDMMLAYEKIGYNIVMFDLAVIEGDYNHIVAELREKGDHIRVIAQSVEFVGAPEHAMQAVVQKLGIDDAVPIGAETETLIQTFEHAMSIVEEPQPTAEAEVGES